jgi:hypothetical protein
LKMESAVLASTWMAPLIARTDIRKSYSLGCLSRGNHIALYL